MKFLRIIFVVCIGLFFTTNIFATDNSFKLDFDGDGRADIALYREGSRSLDLAPQPSYWYFLSTRTSQMFTFQWGRTLDIPAPADFDNDGKTDVGIYRWWNFDTGDTNEWWINKSSSGQNPVITIYEAGYHKFNRNYIGDGRAEIGQLYQINISQIPNEPCLLSTFFIGDAAGNTFRKVVGDACNVIPTPVPGDYNNDGRSEIAVFDNRTFKVWLPPYYGGYTNPDMVQFLDVEVPAPGDYDGDGKTDFAGTKNRRLLWVGKQSSNGAIRETEFGFADDKPVPADYDGDGKTDIAIWRANSDPAWWILQSSTGYLSVWYYGLPTDTPLAMPVIPFEPPS